MGWISGRKTVLRKYSFKENGEKKFLLGKKKETFQFKGV